MAKLAGSRTEQNMRQAFAALAAANNAHAYAAKAIRKEKLIAYARAFEETAEQDLALAKRFWKQIGGEGSAKVNVVIPTESTPEALLRAAALAESESAVRLERGAEVAEQDGLAEQAAVLRAASNAERFHARRFAALADRLASEKPFERDEPVEWLCLKCGYVHKGTSALPKCPACAHPQGYFEVLGEAP